MNNYITVGSALLEVLFVIVIIQGSKRQSQCYE